MLTLISFVIGSIVGSFYNVCIYRLPNDLDVVSKSSFCTSCKYKIPFYLNIPIISYILNFGKCKNCKNKISISYLIVEVLTASLFVYAYMLYGISFNGLAFIIFYSGLLIIFFTDLKYYLILDKITIPLSIVGLVFTFFNFNPFDVDILSSLLGGAVGYLVIYIIRFLFFKIRKVEGMGLGDAKLFLMIGIWLGIKSIYLILASSALVGAVVGSLIIYFYKKDKDFQIPYGCFIVIASALYPYLGSLFYNLI
ncbi:prepilin peptidase [Candidatus Pelagibacter sp. HIMB1321]|uniref:prepilin peptidase n=1 Tax=Candidatus Pelagibacter sp. HIMB1321 TaxID=1388755 RepID=UPI000A0803B0|nr:A24 family peptidase [Candidatus Pelagibacter sp. HIMB1321]SMF77417.1 leader peptidase (prepilin peptidase) / N-methyltransferase [Candidatus Pelagibacter sp. HIMB1321]